MNKSQSLQIHDERDTFHPLSPNEDLVYSNHYNIQYDNNVINSSYSNAGIWPRHQSFTCSKLVAIGSVTTRCFLKVGLRLLIHYIDDLLPLQALAQTLWSYEPLIFEVRPALRSNARSTFRKGRPKTYIPLSFLLEANGLYKSEGRETISRIRIDSFLVRILLPPFPWRGSQKHLRNDYFFNPALTNYAWTNPSFAKNHPGHPASLSIPASVL